MATMRAAALYYATKLGWPVLPIWPIRDGKCACGNENCKSAGKHPISSYASVPLAPRGVLDASVSPAVIKQWWARVPDANIGGRGLPWFALDVDDEDALFELVEAYGKLPDTPMSFSGSGGRHIFFKQTEPPIGNQEGKLPYGLNVRGENGYVILPESSHITGTNYLWEVSSKPTDVKLAEPPDWLIELIGSHFQAVQVDFSGNDGIPDLDTLNISDAVRQDILRTPAPDEDRSSTSQRVITALCDAGCTDPQIRAVFTSYPVGTQSKYAEKEERADEWLARSIGNARSWLKTHSASRAIPGKIITRGEARIEDSVLREVYKKGWHDALTNKMELLKLWPDYLGLDNKQMAQTIVNLYDIGLRTDYVVDDGEYPALAVPLQDVNGKVTNVDYSIYGCSKKRAWESSKAPVFIADLEKLGANKLIVFDDWDVAAYVYLKMSHKLGDVAIASVNVLSDIPEMTVSQLEPLMAVAKESREVTLVWDMHRREEAIWLSSWLTPSKTRWVRWPFPPRSMFKKRNMDAHLFKRALRGAETLR